MSSSTLKIFICTALLSVGHSTLLAQESDSTELAMLSAELDALLSNEDDSLTPLSMIDNLLSETQPESYVSFRLGFSSRATAAGRDFGLDQQGLMPGISFYHKSGLFTDVAGIWNSDLDPQYFATVTTAGYLGQLNKKWSYSVSYDHTFFNTSNEYDTYSLTNSINGSLNLDLGKVYSSADYSFSFGGGETSNRVMWNVSGNFKKKTGKWIHNITFFPTFSILLGNQNLLVEYYDNNRENRIANLTEEQVRQLAEQNGWTDGQRRRRLALVEVLNSRDRTPAQETLLEEFFSQEQEVSYFGPLNYYFSLPVRFSTKKASATLSYNYNIPIEVEGSEYTSESNGYIGFSLSYSIGF